MKVTEENKRKKISGVVLTTVLKYYPHFYCRKFGFTYNCQSDVIKQIIFLMLFKKYFIEIHHMWIFPERKNLYSTIQNIFKILFVNKLL